MIWIYKTTYNKILPRDMPTSIYFKGSRTFMEATDKLGVSRRQYGGQQSKKMNIE